MRWHRVGRRSIPSAAASVREGLDEMFTINRLEVPEQLGRALSSTNAIESTFKWDTQSHPPYHPLARRSNGASLGRCRSAHHREELPTDQGLPIAACPRECLEETDHLDQTEEEI